MNQWPYVIASYVLTLGATALLFVASLVAMRAAERCDEGPRDR